VPDEEYYNILITSGYY